MDAEARQVLEARWRLGDITASDLHRLADERLAAGEDADAATPASVRRRPLTLGEHTNEVLSEVGYCPDEVDELRREKVM